MAPEPPSKTEIPVFPVRKLAPFLRAVADPEGKGNLTPEEADAIRRVEANVARRDERRSTEAPSGSPPVLLAQFARSADAEGVGGELLDHAVGATRRALWWIGATVLVVDPFDEATDSYWREHWGLKPSEQRVPGNRQLRHLWTAIPR